MGSVFWIVVLYSVVGWIMYSLLVQLLAPREGSENLLPKAVLLILGALLSGPMVWGTVIRYWFLRREEV